MCSDKVFITKKYIYFNLFLGGKTMVFEKIREIIAEQTGKDVDEITLETNVKEDLDADSLDLFQIINDIEDEFDVSVEDPESIVTVQDAVDFVESHKN
jgi:acyl carrier protein